MLFSISNGSKSYGALDLFEDINFEINNNEKIALIGKNGAGKSTILKCITNEEYLDKGEIHKQNNIRIGCLKQNEVINSNKIVEEELKEAFKELFILRDELIEIENIMKIDHSEVILDKYARLQEQFEINGGYTYKSELETVFSKFGFSKEDLKKNINSFSGGEQTKIYFVKLLLSKPDILLLDEPTNHLDLDTIKWLEGYLKKYPKSIVLVSHDRTFLDNVVNIVYELEYCRLTKYKGNYSSFVNQKKTNRASQEIAYTNQQREIKRLEALIEKFRYKKNKASFAQSKIKYLDRMDKIEDPKKDDDRTFKAKFKSRVRGGDRVLTTENLVFGFDKPLGSLSIEVRRKDRIGIIGSNGIGKSTLLKTIMGTIPKISGDYLFGHQISIGYFDQKLSDYKSDKTVLEELWTESLDLDMTSIRNILGSFLFSADDVFKSVNVLSGGEKVRLSFAKLLVRHDNLLILDEPTNHLDIPSKEALENSLKQFDGTIIFVSHDRYFIKEIANRIISFEEDGIKIYEYGYSELLEKENSIINEVKKEEVPKEKEIKKVNVDREIKKIEKEISKYEELLEEKRELRFDSEYYHDSKKMDELEDEISTIHNQIKNLEDRWEELMNY